MKKALFIVITLALVLSAVAQQPIHWSYFSKKISDKVYELHFFATIEKPWHTYSLTTPDGGPDPTKIKFNKNPLIVLKGGIAEIGNLQKIHDNAFGVEVKYFDEQVDFVQQIVLKSSAKTSQTGTIEFMVCNDHECLPPKTINFSVAIN